MSSVPARQLPVALNGESTVSDVARRASVSIGTVSRVHNRNPTVAPDLRYRVLRASRELGFIPRQPHACIALITGRRSPALPLGYVSVMLSLITQHLAAREFAVEVIDIENLDMAWEAHIQGAIGVVFDDRLARLEQIPNLPLLTINRPMAHQGIHSIYADHYAQSRVATEYLLAHGHRRIAFLSIEAGEWGSRERRRGYEDALRAAGVEPHPALVQHSIEQPVYDILNRWHQRGVTALLNFSEDVSLEVLHILSNVLRLRIGKDISTISLEDLPIYQYLSPPQTTVRQPLEELACLAVEKMLNLCRPGDDEKIPPSIVDVSLPSVLIERDSVATIK
jgi:DNA-binding LacI/PurR family transcriptional regulator